MAKAALLKNKRRELLYEKYNKIRLEIKKDIKTMKKNKDTKNIMKKYLELDKLPKNSNISRLRNRCLLTGRARGIVLYKLFGLCNFKLRENLNLGYIPGVYKR